MDLPVKDSLQYYVTLYSGQLILWLHWTVHTSVYHITVESVRKEKKKKKSHSLKILFINMHIINRNTLLYLHAFLDWSHRLPR